ncbi:cytochrome c biogenesis protein CCS1, chloroplastic [Populus alba]|uniref:Cytochrome c biogenesis protein CCS1, chloroplastic n=1 Tax=Populus alba TaxID=43335 RepID=A0A4U5Q552_POPAL|nr:cytochrome c biogenesis protein CCS1, chloroplastic [Populus alba]TKS05324.1 cytochrome c biogenesis protein CCS1, chloroplastic [Populus alba]
MDILNPTKPLSSSLFNTHFRRPTLLLNSKILKLKPQTHTLYSNNNKRSRLSVTIVTCSKLKTSKEIKEKDKNASGKILLSNSAPPVLSEESGGGGGNGEKVPVKTGTGALGFLKRLPRKVLAVLSNLPLAIGEMFSIAVLMALGTLIDQGEAPEFYFQKFPEENPLLGFFTWKWVLTLGFDHMYSSPVFLGMLALLGVSLMACTYTTQIPLAKVARRWNYLHSADAIRKQEFSDNLPKASVQDLGVILMGAGYEVFLKGPSLYAFKGLAGRFSPIGVHLAMLLIMGGATLSATGSFRGSVTVPQGLNFVVGDVLGPSGFLSTPTEAFNTEVHVNRFYMDYYDGGDIKQFHTDLSLFDLNGKEVMRKTISVNDPLRYGGITMYQTDWSISALQVRKDDEGPFNLAMAPLKISGDNKLYGTFLPVGDVNSPNVKGISMLARDLQSIVLYDQEGKFVGVRRPNSKLPIDIDGMQIIIEDAIGSSGLELKTDPGVPVVYAGFGALMLTTCLSYLSHSQIWALQDGTAVIVGGKTNRAKAEFQYEINLLLDKVPEIVESSLSKQSDVASG